jgi:hypothetical protein
VETPRDRRSDVLKKRSPGEPVDDLVVENRPPWRWRRVFSQ